MKLKKVLAAVLSAAMVVTSVVMPQGAARVAAAGETKATPDITTGLIAYYGFEDSLENGAKENATATMNKGTAKYSSDGVKGKAFDFSGNTGTEKLENAKAAVQMDVSPKTTAFTVSYWVKSESATYTAMFYEGICTYYKFGSNGDGAFPLGQTDMATAGTWEEKDRVGNHFRTGKDTQTNDWQMVTYTISDKGVVTAYVNGTPVAEYWDENGYPENGEGWFAYTTDDGATYTNMFTDSWGNGDVGYLGSGDWFTKNYSGLMDEVYVYERALSAEDIAELYSVGTTPPTVEKLDIKEDKKGLELNETYQLSTTYAPVYATVPTITWTSANDQIATVDDKGVVTGVANGTTTITATAGGNVSDTCTVTVGSISATSVTPTADKTELLLKETANISYTYLPEDVTGVEDKKAAVTYTSSDTNVLTVDEKTGKVTAVGNGTATVTVTFDGVSGEVEFTVDGDPDSEFISGGWWLDWTKGYELKDDSIHKFKIKVRGGTLGWNNVAAVFASCETDGTKAPTADNFTGYSEYGVIRGDNFGWGTEVGVDAANVTFENDANNSDLIEVMKNADMDVSIQRDGDKIIYTMKAVNGDLTYNRVATFTHEKEVPTYVFFACDTSVVKVTEGDYLVKTAAKAATCTEAGNIEYWTCDGKKYSDAEKSKELTDAEITIPAAHKLTKTEAKPATCTEKGNKAYYTCSVCKKYFEDEEGKTETTLEATVEDLIAHTLVHHDAVAADCGAGKDGAVEYWECSSCNTKFNVGTDPKDENVITDITVPYKHQMTKVEKVEPNCGEEKNGCEAYYTCSGCGKNYKDEAGTEVIDDLADLAIPFEHKWVEDPEKTTATCTEAGTVTRECSVCHKKEEGTPVDKLGHKYGEWETTKEPTCTETGTRTRTCIRTGCTAETEGHIDTETIPAAGHAYNEGEITKEPTCTETGILTKTCTREGCTAETADHTTTEVIPAKGHTVEKVEAKAATCTEAGNEEHYTCTVCGKKFEDAEGTTEITDLTTIEIAALGHTYNEGEVTTAPTCTETGVRTKTCTREGCTAETTGHTTTEVIPAKGHSIVKVNAKAATCTEAGNEEHYTCTDCNKKFEDAEGAREITDLTTIEIAALGHTYNDGEVTTAPTCTEAGVRTKTCTREGCTAETSGHTTTEVIPAKGHTLTKIAAKEATTSAPGNKEYYTCSECGKYFSDAEGTTEITLESTVIPKKTETQKNDTKVTLTLNIGSATLYTGKVANSAVIQAKVTGTSDAVTWNTSNVNVVKVVNGTLKAVGKGTATITAIVKGVSKTVSVTVKDPSIKVKKGKKAVSKVTLKRKKSVKLTVSVSPAKSGLSVAKLSKKDKKKVKVTLKNGKLTIKGKKKGKVTLKIKSGKAVKKIKVTVK